MSKIVRDEFLFYFRAKSMSHLAVVLGNKIHGPYSSVGMPCASGQICGAAYSTEYVGSQGPTAIAWTRLIPCT